MCDKMMKIGSLAHDSGGLTRQSHSNQENAINDTFPSPLFLFSYALKGQYEAESSQIFPGLIDNARYHLSSIW